jgi:cytidylate kinase
MTLIFFFEEPTAGETPTALKLKRRLKLQHIYKGPIFRTHKGLKKITLLFL